MREMRARGKSVAPRVWHGAFCRLKHDEMSSFRSKNGLRNLGVGLPYEILGMLVGNLELNP